MIKSNFTQKIFRSSYCSRKKNYITLKRGLNYKRLKSKKCILYYLFGQQKLNNLQL